MYALVLFEDDTYHICRENRLNNVQGVKCTVKYTNGCRYPARILARHADQNFLKYMQKSTSDKGMASKNEIKLRGRKANLDDSDSSDTDVRDRTFVIDDKSEISVTTNFQADESPAVSIDSGSIECMDKVVPTSASSKMSSNSIGQLSSSSAADTGNKTSIKSDVLPEQKPILEAFTKPRLFSTANAKDNEKAENGVDDNGYNGSANRERNQNSNGNFLHDVSTSANVPGKSTRDDADMFVRCATDSKGLSRKLYCMYCQTMQSKFVRHLENKHKDVNEVKKFATLPKGNPERLKIIDTIRKNCMFDFNTNNAINDGELIVCRRPSANHPKPATYFKICQNCKGFFSKNNLRHHAKRCFGHSGKTNRTLSVLGRKVLGRIHPEASETLRQEIFPVLREDETVRLIRYDRLIILYGNKLSARYGGSQCQRDSIRSQLRLLGRFLNALKRINNQVTDFASIYHPKMYDDAVLAIQEIAGFDSKTKTYSAPSTAYNISTLLKKIAMFYVCDCIKRGDNEQQNKAENFLTLLNYESQPYDLHKENTENIRVCMETKPDLSQLAKKTPHCQQSERQLISDDSENAESLDSPKISSSEEPKKRLTSSYGPVGPKKRWTIEDKEIATKLFGINVSTRTYPSLKEIQRMCYDYPTMRARQPAVIKAWISNEIKKKNRTYESTIQ